MSQATYFGKPFDAQAIDTGSNVTVYSEKFSMKRGSIWSLHVVWTGTPTSTVTLWQSNVEIPDESDDTDWVENTDLTMPAPAGSASKAFLNAGNAGARHYRLKVVTGSGSGTITAHVCGGKGA